MVRPGAVSGAHIMGTIDASLLTSWYNAKAGILDTSSNSGGASASTTGAPQAPTPPWQVTTSTSTSKTGSNGSSSTTPTASAALIASLANGGQLINPSAATLDAPGGDAKTSQDYKSLFGLYQGLSSLQTLAQQLTAKNLGASETSQIDKALNNGLQQVQSFLTKSPFNNFQVYQQAALSTDSSTTGVPQETDNYTTNPIYSGVMNGEVPAFEGNVQFSVNVTKYSGAKVTVNFDLSQMGSQPRTFANVLAYLNGQMKAAGVATRFGEQFKAGAPQTVTSGSTTVNLSNSPDQYSLKVLGTSVETLAFSAPATDPAVYVTQASGMSTGTAADAVQQLAKFDPSSSPVDSLAVNGLISKQALPPGVTSVQATATSSDGSVYVLANVAGTVGSETVNGAQDVALIKYDSAGKVVFTRTLGAATSATGFALAVSQDGSQVAVTGQTADNLSPTGSSSTTTTTSGAAAAPQGFVTVYNALGEEQWTQQTAAIGGQGSGVKPTGVAFGPNGMVYVAGQIDGSIPGGTSSGSTDGFIQGFHATQKVLNDGSGTKQWVVAPSTVQQFGGSSQDRATGIVASGSSVYVSSVENGHAVVRRFDQSGSAGTSLAANGVRDLGSLQGGGVAGVAVNTDGSVVVAGCTHNGALDAGATTQAYAGGEEAFIASLSPDLQASASDRLTYLGSSTDQNATAVTVSGGKVYLAGQIATTPLAGSGQTSAFDGYVAQVDPQTGQVTWSQRYQGSEHQLAPTGIAVASSGASVLDQLGLPTSINYGVSQQLVATSPVRAGDEFFIQSGSGPAKAVTIAADDTYATLAQKIQRASGFTVTATVQPGSNGSTIKLTPSTPSQKVSILAGPQGTDALGGLGLKEGVLTTDATNLTAAANPNTTGPNAAKNQIKNGYNLQLPSSFDLSTAAGVQAAITALGNAIITVQGIYVDMKTPPSAASSSAASGAVPAYLTNEIANYQAALQRLTGSSS